MKAHVYFAVTMLALFVSSDALAVEEASGQAGPNRAALEKDLAQRMNNARLSGYYTIDGQQGPPQQDEYRMGKFEKGEGDKWLVQARIAYGKRVINVPLEIPIFWAGDAPVITLKEFTIPGLGTYSARVMIDGDRYSGTWSAGENHGGFLWGHIEKVAEETPASHREGAGGK